MIWAAPASRAAAIACIPTPPQPTTQTRSPIPTRAAWLTAPYPVTGTAAQQRRLPQRQLGGDRDRGLLGDDRVLGEAGDAEAVLQRIASASVRRELPSARTPANPRAPAGSHNVR